MHELGVLRHAVKKVGEIAEQNRIERIKFVTLEVGRDSTFVPAFFEKLYPIAIDGIRLLESSELKLEIVDGAGLSIKEIGY